nr:MAG TPA_asm: hypothetical protein [Caudoviricetes sp.]
MFISYSIKFYNLVFIVNTFVLKENFNGRVKRKDV